MNEPDPFTRLAREHAADVASYLRRRLYPLTDADLDDLVEETLIVAWRRRDDIPEGAELPWLLGVARNVLRNARRGRARRGRMEHALRAPTSTPSAEDQVVADDAVSRALAQLSDGERDLVLLHAWDGLDTHQLAAHLGVSVNAAAIRLSRALQRFRDLVESADARAAKVPPPVGQILSDPRNSRD